MFVPTDLPGGHFRFRGVYPRARWFSFESYNEALASQGVVDDNAIDPDPGSVSPFLPGKTYHAASRYTVDVRMTPPQDRQSPPPHNVLYAGYRMNRSYGGVDHSPVDGLLYRVYAAPGSPDGDVPLPHLSWVVDDPNTNPFQTDAEVCAAINDTSANHQAILTLNDILDKRFTSTTLSPAERNVDVMTDEVPRNPPFVNVIRPASNGYQGAYFNSKTPYVYVRPDSNLYGRFLVVHFKTPTFTRIEDGTPATGNEQTRYWSWCDAQFVSPVNITQACLMDKQFHIDRNGYATLVFSDPSARHVVKGKLWPDWMPWPGGGADMNMRMIDPNPRTFPQAPYFFPLMNENDGLDYLRGVLFESQLKTFMGPYFPQVKYCSRAQFEKEMCGFPFAGPMSGAPNHGTGTRAHRRPRLQLRLGCRRGRAVLRITGPGVRSVRRATFWHGADRLGSDRRRPFTYSGRLHGHAPYRIRASVLQRNGSVQTLRGTLAKRCSAH